MKRLLVVTASTGTGHNSAAHSLSEALRNMDRGGVEVDTVDLLAAEHSSWLSQPWRLYAPIIVHCGGLWGPVYGLSNNLGFCRLFNGLSGKTRGYPVARLIKVRRPHAVICVHPLGNQVVAQGLRRTESQALLITVITDLAEAHAAWIAPEVSLYVAPTEEVRASLLAKGVGPERIRVLGVPLDQRFCMNGVDARRVRREMGLAEDLFTVMLAGGGEGAGEILSAAQAISRAKLRVQLILVCGHNEGLRRRLGESGLAMPHVTLGFTENMSEVMKAADVVIGKAGALTIGEAIATGRPIVILGPLRGQEKANAEFVVRHRMGLHVSGISSLVRTLEDWTVNRDEMAKLVAEAKCYRRLWTQAAAGIPAAILEEVSRLEKEGSVSCL